MDEDEFGTRRPRSRNWNTAEKFFLFEHVKNRFDIITDPRKEAAFINAKRRVWEQIYHAICKEFGPLEEHLVRGKGGEKCRTQWKNLVQSARKEYKQYMEAKMVGKKHNMTLLSRKICRLMSIDLDDGMGEENEENDWTEDHPEFRYQPELCQELRDTARRINEEYSQGTYETSLPDLNDPGDFEEDIPYEAVDGSDSVNDVPDDEKDEDYAPSSRKTPRKRRRASSGKSSGSRSTSRAQPTRVSARAQAAQAKKLEEEKQAKVRRSMTKVEPQGDYQVAGFAASSDPRMQQEILNLHMVEHKKRMNLLSVEHKTKLQVLGLEKEVMSLQKDYWSKKLENLYDTGRKIRVPEDEDDDDEDDEDFDDNEEVDHEVDMDMSEAGPSGTSASISAPPPPTSTAVSSPPPPAPPVQVERNPPSQSVAESIPPPSHAPPNIPPPAPEVPIAAENLSRAGLETSIPQPTPSEAYVVNAPNPPNQSMESAPPPNQIPQ